MAWVEATYSMLNAVNSNHMGIVAGDDISYNVGLYLLPYKLI